MNSIIKLLIATLIAIGSAAVIPLIVYLVYTMIIFNYFSKETYYLIGFFITLMSIFIYRRKGNTTRKYELYFALIGPFIWPIQIIKWIIDCFNKISK